MVWITKLLNFWDILILSTTESSMVKISEASILDIQTCLQNTQHKIVFLHLESQLQQDELQ